MPVYRKPYPEWVDKTYDFPRGYKMPDFSLFNGEREQSTIEHIARFTTQCSEFTNHDFIRENLYDAQHIHTFLSQEKKYFQSK